MTEPSFVVEIPIKYRSEAGKLRYFAELLDKRGDEPVVRFAVASCLLAMAHEIDGTSGGDDA